MLNKRKRVQRSFVRGLVVRISSAYFFFWCQCSPLVVNGESNNHVLNPQRHPRQQLDRHHRQYDTSKKLVTLESESRKLQQKTVTTENIVSHNDDYYFNDSRNANRQMKMHLKKHSTVKKGMKPLNMNDGNDDTEYKECMERYGLGSRLGMIACQKMSMSSSDKQMMGMMNDMQIGKGSSSKNDRDCYLDGNGKGMSSKITCSPIPYVSYAPSIVPTIASVIQSDQPSTSPVPTTIPTLLNDTNPVSSPTLYPSFRTTTSMEPSKPPVILSPSSSSPITGLPVILPTSLPTQQSTERPTKKDRPPVPTILETDQPTINIDILLRRATPFDVRYNVSDSNMISDVNDDDILTVNNLTIQYIQDYLNEQFVSSNNDIIVQEYLSEILETNKSINPVSITSNFDIIFAESSTFILSQQEIDIIIESAFLVPFVSILISIVQQQFSNNTNSPFATTTSIEYVQRPDLDSMDDKFGRNNDSSNQTNSSSSNDTDSYNENQDSNYNTSQTPPPIIINDYSPDVMMQRYEETKIKMSPFYLLYYWDSIRIPASSTDEYRNETNGSNSGSNMSSSSDTYLLVDNVMNISMKDTKDVVNVTLVFLNDYLRMMINSIYPDSYVYLAGYGIGNIQNNSMIEYRVGIEVTDHLVGNNQHNYDIDAIIVSLQEEIDMIVQTAFVTRYVTTYITKLQTHLNHTNPFSNCTDVYFEFLPSSNTNNDGNTLSLISILCICLVCIIIFSVLLIRLLYHYRILQKQPKRYKLPPNIIIHTNHDSIHGDLIEIISTDDNDSAAVYDYENSIHHVGHHPYNNDDDDNDVLSSSSVSSSSIRQRLIQSNDKDTVSSYSLKPYTLFETVD